LANLSGKDLGKYLITDRIDSGGMAEVYLGVHKHLDRKVAIKVLHGHLLEGGDFLARFEREAKAVASLRHPNIVQVLDFDVQDEIIFMVMEYIEGTNLQKRLDGLERKGERLSIAQIGSIINDVADALDYAHSKDMLHRDVKPSNILLDKNDKAYLTDFGIARIMGDQKFTATGTLIGTPAYMSPEQGTGEELSIESDIYSLGVVAFEMITGQVPYDAPTPIGIVHKQVYDPIPDIADLVDDVPESTQEVIDTVLAKSPDSRYSSADALVTALRGALVALEAVDPTLKEIEVADPNEEDKAQYAATVMMEEPPKTEELDQATGLMEATKAAQQEEELSATIVDPGIEDQLEEVESERKIPIWGVVIGVVAVIGIVGVILSQVIDFGSSTSEPLSTQSSSDPDPTETESSSKVDSGYSGGTVGVANPQSSDGVIVIWDAGGDADIELVAVDGEEAWRTGTGRNLPSSDESQTADYYMIVDVDDEFMFRGKPTSEVVIELEYLDEGIDRFRLEYDAVTGGPYGDGKFKETDWVAKTDSGEFKSAVFHLDDANFGNRIQDGDFRLNDDADGFETIRSVSVTLPSLLEEITGDE
jgi:serine/threonine protein kinase